MGAGEADPEETNGDLSSGGMRRDSGRGDLQCTGGEGDDPLRDGIGALIDPKLLCDEYELQEGPVKEDDDVTSEEEAEAGGVRRAPCGAG